MAYSGNRPVTTGNCPTREALERKPGDKGFLVESIHARHSEKKKLQHIANQNTRRDQNQRRGK
mgnify:CR=1 FL=1